MLFGKTAQRICRRLTTTLTVSLAAGDGLGMMQKVRCIAEILRWIRFQFNGATLTVSLVAGDGLGMMQKVRCIAVILRWIRFRFNGDPNTTGDMLRCGWRCSPIDFVLKILRWIHC